MARSAAGDRPGRQRHAPPAVHAASAHAGHRGSGERKTLRLVAQYAQHWNAIVRDAAEWQHEKEVLLAQCADVGREAPTAPTAQPAEVLKRRCSGGRKRSTPEPRARRFVMQACCYRGS